MKRKIGTVFLPLTLLLVLLTGCASSESIADNTSDSSQIIDGMRCFTDSCGREVILPVNITKIAVSGPLAQIYVYPICSDLFVGFSTDFPEAAKKFIPGEYLTLPIIGQLYGGRGTLDLESLLAASPQVVIDMGESKGSIAGDLNSLSEQCGIPFVHIESTVETAGDAYRMLGELIGRTEKAEELALWCESTLSDIDSIMTRVDADNARRNIIYCLGDKGLNCLANSSFHAVTVNRLGNNVAEINEAVSSGLGNEIDMEQLLIWDPEVIIFAPDSYYDRVAGDETWQLLNAVKNGEYYKTPIGPYGWMASPPAIQQYLGMLWMGAVLYPEYIDYDLKEEVTDYFSLFYNYELSEADYIEMISR